jgi:hypothetical protein
MGKKKLGISGIPNVNPEIWVLPNHPNVPPIF